MPYKHIDVLIVGGGPAGLSAALVLGRALRKVLVCDDGLPRNRSSHAVHGLLGREGGAPHTFLADARKDLARYTTVTSRASRVTEINSASDGFVFTCADGTEGLAAKVLLATGLVDHVPAIPGANELYGKLVHHCLYCDGYEYAGKPLAAYGHGDKGAELALMMSHWSKDLIVYSDGTPMSLSAKDKLEKAGLRWQTEKIRALQYSGSHLLINMDARVDERSALFFSTGCHQASDLSEKLGCARDAKGGVITDSTTEGTSVPGVYVAGDASRDVLMVVIAMAEGAKAAVAINKALLKRDGLCD